MTFRLVVHPGEILGEDLEECGVSPSVLAKQIDVAPETIEEIISGSAGVTGDIALRLGALVRNERGILS